MSTSPTKQDNAPQSPRVSIGLPVFNAERYLEEAIDSLLAQTFTDFEIVIADNASTDATAAICRRYAASDSRIRYHRNEVNVGAAANFDLVFELSQPSEYFKWAAGDDLCTPDFLERCVTLLDADSGAVLAYPRTRLIDADGEVTGEYDVKLETDSENPVRRFRFLMRGHKCFEIFGLIRRHELAQTPLMGAYSHGDGVLLARLALQGRFEEIPECLFLSRRHAEQSGTLEGDRQKYAVWFAPQLAGKTLFPHWRTYYEFLRSIHLARGLTVNQRMRCYQRFFSTLYSVKRVLADDLAFHTRRLKSRLMPGAGRPLG